MFRVRALQSVNIRVCKVIDLPKNVTVTGHRKQTNKYFLLNMCDVLPPPPPFIVSFFLSVVFVLSFLTITFYNFSIHSLLLCFY